MRKRVVSFLVLLLLGFAGLAAATYVGDLLRAGIDVTGSGIVFNYDSIELEGATEDAYETSVAVTDPTADRTITIPDGNQTIGTATAVGDDPTLSGSIAHNVFTVTNTTDGASIDVGSYGILEVDTSAANATLQSFANGVDGQIVRVVVVDTTNNAIMKHQNATGQQFNLSGGADETEGGYGGWALFCNGTQWFEIEQ